MPSEWKSTPKHESVSQHSSRREREKIILIELNGGVDYLNTVIPYKEKNYYDLRPSLALNQEEYNILDKNLALNSSMPFLSKTYKNKNLAIINGLGYKKPNLSHFRAIQIVETASESNEYLNKGWLSSLENFELSPERPAQAIVIGKRKKPYLFSSDIDILQIKNVKDFIKKSSSLRDETYSLNNSNELNFLSKQKKSIQRANKSLSLYIKEDFKSEKDFEFCSLSKSFKEALVLLDSKLSIPVIKVSQKSYDTHSNQKERLDSLLKDLDKSLESFVYELKKRDLFNNVLIMTYSEFGRRVKENGSNGTDHGTATFSFILGGDVKGGMYGEYPSLDNLDKNNQIYTLEYKTLYNTILSKWFLQKNNKFNTYDILNFI
ncbi:MAG: DUF1501 domain-containing protein [Campylobacteraceae bacterium]|nr:DUF1501 domain-containing protein [Campylobacteraceae bacterium]